MTLVRTQPTPSEITMLGADAGLVELAHTRASRIEADDGGFVTFSDTWVARYDRVAKGYRLDSVVPAKGFRKPIDVKPLGGDLFARRTDGRGWNVRICEGMNAPRWPFEALLGAERTFLADRNTALETSGKWARSLAMDGTVRKRWADARTAPLAIASAYRSGELIVAGKGWFRIGGDQAIEESKADGTPRDPGRFEFLTAETWAIALAKSGSELQFAHHGVELAVADGALPMDFAIAAGAGESHTWLVDRFGAKMLSNTEDLWSAHSKEVRELVANTPSSRVRAFNHDGSIGRFIGTNRAEASNALLLPRGPDPQFEPVTLDKSIESWTRGAELEIQFGTDGMVLFRRKNAGSSEFLEYKPIKKDDCCSVGRFAFDVPSRLLLAARPGGTKPEPCVEMRLGWEWPIAAEGSRRTTALDVKMPTAIEPEFGPVSRQEWISDTDLTLKQLVDAERKAGKPIIWYPFMDRLFLVGDQSVVWIELGDRWRSRSLN